MFKTMIKTVKKSQITLIFKLELNVVFQLPFLQQNAIYFHSI